MGRHGGRGSSSEHSRWALVPFSGGISSLGLGCRRGTEWAKRTDVALPPLQPGARRHAADARSSRPTAAGLAVSLGGGILIVRGTPYRLGAPDDLLSFADRLVSRCDCCLDRRYTSSALYLPGRFRRSIARRLSAKAGWEHRLRCFLRRAGVTGRIALIRPSLMHYPSVRCETTYAARTAKLPFKVLVLLSESQLSPKYWHRRLRCC